MTGQGSLRGKTIVLGVTGSIAAFKAVILARRLIERGATVLPVLTAGASRFVGAVTFSGITGQKVAADMWDPEFAGEMHVALAERADLVVVAPTTADLLARVATGRADDLLAALVLCARSPVLLAPAMHPRMWDHPAVRANVATLAGEAWGGRVQLVGPTAGAVASGESGLGRMVEPEEIVAAIEARLGATSTPPRSDLAGYRLVISAGPTQEAIDPVRFISNRSSGKQGHAIAAAFAKLGAHTVLITGPTAEIAPPGVAVVRVESAEQMLAACRAALPVDVAICAAAVSDWKPADPAPRKLKKQPGATAPALELLRTPDILAELSQSGPQRPRMVVGFALETENLIQNATEKLKAKGCDWIVANAASQESTVFGSDHNTVALVTSAGSELWPRISKHEVGQRLAASVADYLEAGPSATAGTSR